MAAQTRQHTDLAAACLRLLHASRRPVSAPELLRRLRGINQFSTIGDHDLDSVLAGELSAAGLVQSDRLGRWVASDYSTTPATGISYAKTDSGNSLLTDDDLESISAAVSEEIAAGKDTTRTTWLEIDGIEHVTDIPGLFVYTGPRRWQVIA